MPINEIKKQNQFQKILKAKTKQQKKLRVKININTY